MNKSNIKQSFFFDPFVHKKIWLKNRFVMAPMTREWESTSVPNQKQVDYYRARADGNVGLIVTEGTCIDHPGAIGHTTAPLIYGEEALAGWKNVVDKVHQVGGKIISQLWHVGAMRPTNAGLQNNVPAYSPSGLINRNQIHGIAMTEKDIVAVVDSYARAAKNARDIGFDGIEIHGAHGYLIDQFFWSSTNQRKDDFGGTLINRCRFAKNIVEAIRKAVGSQFLVCFRWSQWKMQDYDAQLVSNPLELEVMLRELTEAGVDLFHTSTRRFWQPAFDGSSLSLAGWTRKLSACPTIAVGGVGAGSDFLTGATHNNSFDILKRVNIALENEEFDLIAVGRALLNNPRWVELLAE